MSATERFGKADLRSFEPRLANLYELYKPGDIIHYPLYAFQPDGTLQTVDQRDEISDVKHGGFYGGVLILKDRVIKTTQPDPWHDLWKRANWGGRDFPAQVSSTAAALDHLKAKMVHDFLPVASNGEFHAPASYGFTKLPEIKYGQVLERVLGRIPRYDDPKVDEGALWEQKGYQLSQLLLEHGFEIAAQTFPGNPAWQPNLWKRLEREDGKLRDTKQWWMVDDMAALPHKAFYWPWYREKFYKDIGGWFYHPDFKPKGGTFNKLHTGYLLTELQRNSKLYDPQVLASLRSDAQLYEELAQDIEGLKTRRRIFPMVRAAYKSVEGAVPIVAQAVVDKAVGSVRMVTDADYLNKKALEGVARAHRDNLVSDNELAEVVAALNDNKFTSSEMFRRGVTLTAMAGYYAGTNYLGTLAELGAYKYNFDTANSVLRFWALNIPIWLVGRLAPPVIRYFGTKAIGKLTGVNTDLAAEASKVIFGGGNFLPFPALLASSAGSKGRLIWHYSVREWTAAISKFCNPAFGGWGTSSEYNWWKKRIGRRIEKMAKF